MAAIEQSPGGVITARDMSEIERFYQRAKETEWQLEDLPWGHAQIPPIPEPSSGLSPQRQAERRGIWRSVVGQQLQADLGAIAMGTQLLQAAPDIEARQYYSTLVQDEVRHTIAWEKLTAEIGPASEEDPYLSELIRMVLEADELEQKVFMMQVFFERAIIRDFQEIIEASDAASKGRHETTVLAELCKKLKVDDGIHHGSGMAYEKVLLSEGSKTKNQKIAAVAELAFPVFAKHKFWRPPERRRFGDIMIAHDVSRIRYEADRGIKDARKLGIELGHVSVAEVIDRAMAA